MINELSKKELYIPFGDKEDSYIIEARHSKRNMLKDLNLDEDSDDNLTGRQRQRKLFKKKKSKNIVGEVLKDMVIPFSIYNKSFMNESPSKGSNLN